MNHLEHYFDLITSRQDRELEDDVYYERHHIVPSCIGGTDDDSNLIHLTAREHYVAHLLLWKAAEDGTTENRSLAFAVAAMIRDPRGHRKYSSRQYKTIREAFVDALTGRTLSEETKQKISKAHLKNRCNGIYGEEYRRNLSKALKGGRRTEEQKKKISNALKGREFSDEHKANLSKAARARDPETRMGEKNPMWGKHLTDEHKKKLSEALKGREGFPSMLGKKHSQETLERMKKTAQDSSVKEAKYGKVTCPHCGKEGARNAMARWHFDNCKSK